jgi:hypothetical protein
MNCYEIHFHSSVLGAENENKIKMLLYVINKMCLILHKQLKQILT